MPVHPPRHRYLRATATLATASVCAVAAPASATSLPPPERPALSVRIDDGTMKTKEKQHHTYTVLVRNLGSTDFGRMTLTQSLPPGMSLTSATDGPTVRGADGRVAWTVDLAAGEQLVRTVKARVDELPSGEGIASTACVSLAESTAPVVCSTDFNQLPSKAERADAAGFLRTTLIGTLVAALAAIGGAAWYIARRRRITATAATAD